ncbi:MAG: M28 family metallopeptidase [Maribacter sp.]
MRIYRFILLALLCTSCAEKLVPTSLNEKEIETILSKIEQETMRSLNTSVEELVNAGGNIKRGKAIVKRSEQLDLADKTHMEHIDWLSFQKNVLIELKGKTDSIVYIVSHYDKTDTNPLVLFNKFLNGLFDPLISWSYSSDGAIDNATGVAVSLQLAKALNNKGLKYTYRILLVGAEESGLRGSRAHVARIPQEEFSKVIYMINMDVIGVKNKRNCVSSDISNSILSTLALESATELGMELGAGSIPVMACSDYASFKKTSFFTDFGRSLQFNLVGAFLPQRSYFTKSKSTEIINFSSCNLIDAGDYIGGTILLPIGSIHGFRDSINLVDETKLYEQYQIVYNFILKVERLNNL